MNHFLNLRQDTTQHSADVYISFSSFTSREKTNLQTMIFRKHSLLMKAIPGFQIQDEHLFIPCSQVNAETAEAYKIFAEKLLQTACLRKWIKSGKIPGERAQSSSQPLSKAETLSEKYSFRIWLNQLGLKGTKYAKIRKILTCNLSGNSAYPTDEKMSLYNKRRHALRKNNRKKQDFYLLSHCKTISAINQSAQSETLIPETLVSETLIPQTVSQNTFSINKTVSNVVPTAVYCRVSTDTLHQRDSLENQISHYREMLQKHSKYHLTKIYYDQGISGYKEKRPGFEKMLQDAKKGCFQQIITKSITRFARNTDTILKTTRWLKKLGIDVYFELQGIHTLSQDGELLLTLYAAFGQAESENARKLSQMMIQRKYKKGQPVRQLHRCLGYEKDLYGNLIPDKNADLVRQIFQLAAEENSIAEITRYLNEKKIRTQNGKTFSRSTVRRILHNNAYKGDYICQRYYVDSNRKLVRNKGEKPMYYIRQDHIPIISCDLWEKAQNALKKSRYKQVHNLEKKPVCDKAIDNLPAATRSTVPLSLENYPYKNRIFCKYCGARLRRIIARNGSVWWICNTLSRKGKNFCKGIRVPDSRLQPLRNIDIAAYIGKEIIDGKEIYGYSTEPDSCKN